MKFFGGALLITLILAVYLPECNGQTDITISSTDSLHQFQIIRRQGSIDSVRIQRNKVTAILSPRSSWILKWRITLTALDSQNIVIQYPNGTIIVNDELLFDLNSSDQSNRNWAKIWGFSFLPGGAKFHKKRSILGGILVGAVEIGTAFMAIKADKERRDHLLRSEIANISGDRTGIVSYVNKAQDKRLERDLWFGAFIGTFVYNLIDSVLHVK